MEKETEYEDKSQDTINVARLFELGLLSLFIKEYRIALEADTEMERAQAIARLRNAMQRQCVEFKKKVSKASKNDMKAIGELAYKNLHKKSKKLVKPTKIVNQWQKKNDAYWRKYIKSKGTNLVINDKGIIQTFKILLDQDVKGIVDGTLEIDKAVANTIHKLSKAGVDIINYKSGAKRNIEVFVRQQMVYASKESSNDLRKKNAEKDGVTIWEWTAHADARPSHKLWQGKRFDTTGKYYPKSVSHGEENDYGCLHRAMPVYDKDDPYAYSKKELDNIDTKPFKWNGKTYTGYEAKQQMRAMERKIRQCKREIYLLEENSLNGSESAKSTRYLLKKANSDYSSFCKAYGTYRRSNRLKI